MSKHDKTQYSVHTKICSITLFTAVNSSIKHGNERLKKYVQLHAGRHTNLQIAISSNSKTIARATKVLTHRTNKSNLSPITGNLIVLKGKTSANVTEQMD